MPWVKGQSGNPAGKPKRVHLHDVRQLAREYTTQALDALLEALSVPGERVPAANALLAYGYGKPVTRVDVRKITSFEDLTDEELAQLVAVDGAGGDDVAPEDEVLH